MARIVGDHRIKTLWGPRPPDYQPGQETFNKFLQLPQELQDLIWHLFCPGLIHPRLIPMIWCYQLSEQKAEDGSACMDTVGLRDYSALEFITRSFRIYSAVCRATRTRALACAPDILEFCGCGKEPGEWLDHDEEIGIPEPNRANGFFRYNASRDVIQIRTAELAGRNESTPVPGAPHIGICLGEKRSFQGGRLGPRHVAIEGIPSELWCGSTINPYGDRISTHASVSPAQLAEALSCMFPGCHTFYHGWEPHPFTDPALEEIDIPTIPFEGDNLGEVSWLASSRVTRVEIRGDNSCRLFCYPLELCDPWTSCWVNAEMHPEFAGSLPYRRFAQGEELQRELMLTTELRKRSFNTSYMMEFSYIDIDRNPYKYYDPDDARRYRIYNAFDLIVQRVKSRSEQDA